MRFLKSKIRIRNARNRKLLRVAPVVAIMFGLTMLFPTTAHAEAPGFDFLQPAVSLKNFVCYLLVEGACVFLNIYSYIIKQLTANSILTAPFSSLLGSDMYALTSSVFQAAVVPLAESILALFMLIQLVKISQRIDATSTLPAVKDIVFLFVTFVIMHWFIVNALDIMQAIYQIVVDNVIPHIGGAADKVSFFSGTFNTDSFTDETWNGMSIGGAFGIFLVSIISSLIGIVVYLVALVVSYARAWQIYILAAFSAIPMSLLGFDETRQIGVGFLKNFASACLAGAVMIFLFVAYPYIVSGLVGADAATASILDFIPSTLADPTNPTKFLLLIKFLAASVLFFFAIVKSGAWAKEILGS